MAKHKVVKAKAKASTVVSNVTKGVKGKDVPKASMPKADILINSIVTAFMYPNRNAGEVNHVRVNLKGKDTNLDGLTKAKLNINDLNIDELIKQLFISLTGHSIDKFMYGYKNAYNFAFGIVPKGVAIPS